MRNVRRWRFWRSHARAAGSQIAAVMAGPYPQPWPCAALHEAMKYPAMEMDRMAVANEGRRAAKGISHARYQKWTMGEQQTRAVRIKPVAVGRSS